MLPLHASIGMKYDMTMSERVLLKSYLCPDLIEGSEQVSCNWLNLCYSKSDVTVLRWLRLNQWCIMTVTLNQW